MVSSEYLSGRMKWYRPQAMIWSDVPFILVDGGYVPPEMADEGTDFIIVTDHSRDPIDISYQRIESRSRMINGTSRSHYVTDKIRISTGWSMLPGRIASVPVTFDQVTGAQVSGGETYIADSASAALDIKQWYETHPGPFYVYLSYDLGSETDTMTKYATMKKMFFESFSGSIPRRGIYDMWNISISLDEV